mmetsp:Transcript_36178/g.81738  ORF Transcript_36178/g.81738 Transcript_36178/m.81738 type:complete len:214 (-) Transcript_36178:322-963(-)
MMMGARSRIQARTIQRSPSSKPSWATRFCSSGSARLWLSCANALMCLMAACWHGERPTTASTSLSLAVSCQKAMAEGCTPHSSIFIRTSSLSCTGLPPAPAVADFRRSWKSFADPPMAPTYLTNSSRLTHWSWFSSSTEVTFRRSSAVQGKPRYCIMNLISLPFSMSSCVESNLTNAAAICITSLRSSIISWSKLSIARSMSSSSIAFQHTPT